MAEHKKGCVLSHPEGIEISGHFSNSR